MNRLSALLLLGTLSAWAMPWGSAMANFAEAAALDPEPVLAQLPIDQPSYETPFEIPGSDSDSAEPMDAALDSNVVAQANALVQSARELSQQGNAAAAIAQLSQATEQAETITGKDSRDDILSSIGFVLLDLNAFEQAEAVAQTMTYETFGSTEMLRVELEKALTNRYIQLGQQDKAIALIQAVPEEKRETYWVVAIEALIKQGEIAEAVALYGNFIDVLNLRHVAFNAINRAYIGTEKFDEAQAFANQDPFADPADKVNGLKELALWLARAGQLEKATDVANQLPAQERLFTLIELAKLNQTLGQNERAIVLLEEAEALPHDANESSIHFSNVTQIALAYVALGQPKTAEQLLTKIGDSIPPLSDPVHLTTQFIIQRIDAFAKVGAFNRATQLLIRLPEESRPEGRFRIATAYTDRGYYEQAITMAGQIPDRVLFPLPEYPDPKIELLNRIVVDSVKKGEFATAQRAVQIITSPVDKLQALDVITKAYQAQNKPRKAIATLDQALAIAKTIDNYSVQIERSLSIEYSSARLLLPIAEAYWTVNAQDKAISTAELALVSIQKFQNGSNSPWEKSWPNIDLIERIGLLGRDWQQPSLQQAALAEMNNQAMEISESETPVEPAIVIDSLFGLVELAYEPTSAPSELYENSLARLVQMAEDTTDEDQKLSVLYALVDVYYKTDQPALARVTVESILSLSESLPEDLRDDQYMRLALATIDSNDTELRSQLISKITSAEKRVDLLTQVAQQFAAQDNTEQAIAYFDQAMTLAQQTFTTNQFDERVSSLTRSYSRFVEGQDYKPMPERTPAEIAIMQRLPEVISDPWLKSTALMSFALNFPPNEAKQAYEALPNALAEISDPFVRRNLLWEEVVEAISYKRFDHATAIANQLDGNYKQSALGLIEMAR
jgi:thioredoxin-like negative regulator of GroEL